MPKYNLPPPPNAERLAKYPWLRESILECAIRITEDAEDIADIEARRGSPTRPFDEFVAEMKARGEL